MKATKLLKEQHREVEKLFARIKKAAKPSQRREVFQMLAHALVAHDTIEQKIFYPACEQALGMNDQLGEALVEHRVVEFCLDQVDRADSEEVFEYRMTVLEEIVKHHVHEEEHELFPRVEQAMTDGTLDDLGGELSRMFEATLHKDYRRPLSRELSKAFERPTEMKRAAKKPRASSASSSRHT